MFGSFFLFCFHHFYLSLFYANTSKEKDKSFVDAISEKIFGKSNYGDKYFEYNQL